MFFVFLLRSLFFALLGTLTTRLPLWLKWTALQTLSYTCPLFAPFFHWTDSWRVHRDSSCVDRWRRMLPVSVATLFLVKRDNCVWVESRYFLLVGKAALFTHIAFFLYVCKDKQVLFWLSHVKSGSCLQHKGSHLIVKEVARTIDSEKQSIIIFLTSVPKRNQVLFVEIIRLNYQIK